MDLGKMNEAGNDFVVNNMAGDLPPAQYLTDPTNVAAKGEVIDEERILVVMHREAWEKIYKKYDTSVRRN